MEYTVGMDGSCCSPQAEKPRGESLIVQYKPLIVIVSLITLVTTAAAVRDVSSMGYVDVAEIMMNFMAGFFLVFSGLKLMDIAGFARGYAMYDLLAAKVPAYGYVYPFLELGLGLAYLTHFEMYATNIVTVVLMTFSALGVARSLVQKKQFQCACLGTLLKVPLTKVALIEDVSMALMAGFMLWF